MKSLPNLELNREVLQDFLNPKDVWIEVFHAECSFTIEGIKMEGFLKDNKVLETDKICLRYSWDIRDYIDVEVYGQGRGAWYRLTNREFAKIRNFIQEIH